MSWRSWPKTPIRPCGAMPPAAGAARLVARLKGGQLTLSVLRRNIADPGGLSGAHCRGVLELAHASTRLELADERLEELRFHSVAAVRTAANGGE